MMNTTTTKVIPPTYWRELAGKFAAISSEASRAGDLETAVQCFYRAREAIAKSRCVGVRS
jgi:hypothetical protein